MFCINYLKLHVKNNKEKGVEAKYLFIIRNVYFIKKKKIVIFNNNTNINYEENFLT